MQYKPGDVMRLEYKWPHQAKKEDGNKARPAVVFQDLGGKYFASPMTTVPPDEETKPYAIAISPALQRQLGIADTKPSWVYANYANLVEPPNPAIVKARHDSWLHGQVSSGLLAAIKQRRNEALGAGHMKIATIRRDETLDRYRSSERLQPGRPGNNDARASDVQKKAADRVAMLAIARKHRDTSLTR